jgi:hypothetical protein
LYTYSGKKFCKIKVWGKEIKCLEAFGFSYFRSTSACNQTEQISIPVINMFNMEKGPVKLNDLCIC